MPDYTGTGSNDTFTGTSADEIINGLGGNDVLYGGDGNDTIDGGAGQDQIYGEGGDDTLVISVASVGGEIYNGGTGTDTLQFLSSAANLVNTVNGPQYQGSLTGQYSSIERVEFGSAAGTSLSLLLNWGALGSGIAMTSAIEGGDGNDQLTIFTNVAGIYTVPAFTYVNWTNADEAFEAGDSVVLIGSGTGSFTLNAATNHLGVQALIGGLGNDTLNGSDGLEVLNGGGGINTLNAGGGDDVLVAVNNTPFGGVPNYFTFAGNQYNGGAGFDWLSIGGYVNFQGNLNSIEGINFQAAFTATAPGTASQGEAYLEIESSRFDVLPATLNLRGVGTLSLSLGAGENFDGSQWVHLSGSNVHVEVFGTNGDENFIGTSGNDRFSGGMGASLMTGGLGADQFEAGEGQATVSDFSIAQGDRVDLQDMNITSFEQLLPYLTQVGSDVVFSRLFGGVAQTMTLQNVQLSSLTANQFIFQTGDDNDVRDGTEQADELIGGNGNDTLNGFGGNDILFGGGGNDTLNGGAGDDLIDGGDGSDTMTGGSGNDIYILGAGDSAFEAPGEGTDEIRTSIDWTLPDDIENLAALGTGNLFLGGNSANNVITGNSGNNYIVGQGGNDTIDGGAGHDIASFQLPGNTTGTLQVVQGNGGVFLVQLVQQGGTVETVFEVTPTGPLSATVTGVNSMSSLGTDTVTNVEDLHFFANTYPDPTPQNLFVSLPLAPYVGPVQNGFAHVGGSIADDVIDLAALYPGEPASTAINANGGAGNDTIRGTDGGNFLSGDAGNDIIEGRGGNDGIRGGDGNDTIDGGAGNDWADFALPASTPGTLRYVEGNGDQVLVQLVQADGSFQDVFQITATGGGWTVTGVGIAANHGTDTVTNVEWLNFFIDVYPTPHAPGQYLGIPVAIVPPAVVNGGAHVGGTIADDVIDLQVLYPDAAATAQLNANGGIGDDTISGTDLGNYLEGGTGNDTLNGRGGNDTLVGSIGNDTLDGGANQDQAQFVLNASLSGTWLLVKNGDGTFSAMLTRNGVQEEAFRLTHNSGTWTVEGRNSASYLGTDTLTNVETVGFFFEGPFNNATSLFIQLSPIVAQNGTQLGGLLDDVMDFSGLTGPVTVNGNFGNDTITGTNANDSLNGGADNDTISGLGGDDFIQGQQGDDTLTGGGGNDNLQGGIGNDQLSGGDGNDVLRGGAGVDSYDGGNSTLYTFNGFGDRISFYDQTATQAVVADLRTGIISNDGFGNAETMVGIESLGSDTAFADTFHGDDNSNTLFANRGDMLYGHGGNDDISVASAAAVVDGGDGNDILFLDTAGGFLTPDANGDGLAEIAAAATGGWTVNLATGSLADSYGNVGTIGNVENITGSSLGDVLTGDNSANILAGGYGNDSLFGGDGNDTLTGDEVVDFVDGVPTVVPALSPEVGGNDILDGGAGNDLLIGGVGNDQLRGGDGDDVLQGGTGNDLLRGGSGVDSFDGGTGGESLGNNGYGDRVSFYDRAATAAVVADLRDGTISNDGFGNVETMTGIESLGADTAYADTFHGNDGTNVLFGNSGDNLHGHGGDDYFSLSSAAAVVDGGDGVDRLTINVSDGWLAPDTNGDGLAELMAAATAGWSVNLTTGVITDGYGNVGAVSNVENVEGSQLNDVIVGTNGANILEGGSGNDTLRGGDGDDVLTGGEGNDFLSQTLGGSFSASGMYGNDVYDGGAGSDRVSLFTTMGAGVTVDLNVTAAQDTGAAGIDTFIGIEHITATFGNDHLTGTAGANFFWTFGGSDTLIGNGGDDYFIVGRDNKVIDGGSGVDTIDIVDDAFTPLYTAEGITVSLLLQGQAQSVGTGTWTLNDIENLSGNYGSDDFTGDGNANVLAGHSGDDILRGGGGDDILAGDGYFDWNFNDNVQFFVTDQGAEGGNDILEGGAGNDTLYGGGGNDVLRGQAGNDLHYGGAGNDTMVEGGGNGNDLYDGGAGSDRVSFFLDTFGSVTVDLRITTAQNTGRGLDTFVGVEHITGDYGNDTLTGNEDTNWFWTFAGNDVLSGNGGDDYFTVGYGTKVIDGGTGSDVLEISDTAYVPMYTLENGVHISLELQGQAQDTNIGSFTISNIENLSGDVGNDTFIGDGNANILAGYSGDDTLRGGGGNDTLSGDGTFELDPATGELVHRATPSWATPGNDALYGGDGDDTLIGGGGADAIDGGAGHDTAVFTIPGDNPGTLSVVVVGEEKHVLLTNGDTVTKVATISFVNGVLLVTGEGPAASLGYDSVVRTEVLRFETSGSSVSVEIDTGVVADGLVAQADVFMDANHNGTWDVGEARTTTAADGSFSFLVPGSGPIIATGGYNIDTGLMNLVTLAAPEGSSVVNPLTTLVEAVVSASGGTLTAEEASVQVAASLGLSTDIDLLNTDIYTQATGGDTAALEAQKAAAIIVTILVAADDAGGNGTAANVMQGLADVVLSAPPEGISLTDQGTIVEVLSSALPPETVDAMAADLAVSAQAIDDAENSEGLSDAQAASLTTGNDLANTLRGGIGDDALDGRGGNDTLYGYDGNDLLDGGSGIDEMAGGYGDDDYVVDHVADLVVEAADSGGPWSYIGGYDRVWSSVTYTLAQNVEALVLTGAAAINGTGNAVENEIIGNDFANQLSGLGGMDSIYGGGGNDTLSGGDDEDLLYGEAGDDWLIGGAGVDRLNGGEGADTMEGGLGGDIYEADAFDTIIELEGGGNDYVSIATSYTLGAHVESLSLAGSASVNGTGNGLDNHLIGNGGDNLLSGLGGNDIISGNAGNDVLDGGAGNDLLSAGNGTDVLTGGTGTDILFGGSGVDSFRDTAAGFNGDTIDDLAIGETLVFTDANLSTFNFSLSGNTLTYSGGTLTLQNGVSGRLIASAAAGGGVQLTLSDTPRDVANDFNGDGRSDVLWRNSNGVVANWLGQPDGSFGGNLANSYNPIETSWCVEGSGDFNGDGRDDILWRHIGGDVTNWLGQANGGFVGNYANALISIDNGWQVAGVGDFNGDGRDDVLWRSADGAVTNWLGQANGSFVGNYVNSLIAIDNGWQVMGVGDFNGDGRDDVLWRNSNGDVTNWLGQGNGSFAGNYANSLISVDNGWQIAGVGDFNGDGRDDVLWRDSSGVVTNWLGQANGRFAGNIGNSYNVIDTSWGFAGVGDYDGDGRDDVLWRNESGIVTNWLGQANGNFAGNFDDAYIGIDNGWSVQPTDLI